MKILTTTAAAWVLAIATAASAQEAPVSSTPVTEQAQEDGGIADIVVTASRREESAQRAALAIQVLSADALDRANVTRPEDISSIAPGVQIATGGNYPQVYVRGVGNFATGGLAEGAVAFNIDGVYVSRAQGVRGVLYDLERVEVLKGPQGTLYGRNASGGAINIITAKPKLGTVEGYLEGQVGNYDLAQGSGAINLPLGDSVAIRAAGQVVSRDGYLTDGYEDEKTQSARLQLLWKPSSDISLLLGGGYQHVGGRGAGGVVAPRLPGDKFLGASEPAATAVYDAQPGIGPLLTRPGPGGFVDYTTWSVNAELNWNMGFANLTVLPAYRDSRLHDLSFVPGFSVDNNVRSKQTSVEARLGNNDSTLKWVLGGYFFDERQTSTDGGPQLIANQGPLTQIAENYHAKIRSYAVFGQATYSVTDTLRLTGGLRYTYERKDLDQDLITYSLPSPGVVPPSCPEGTSFDPTTPVPPRFCYRFIDMSGANGSSLTYRNVTFKAGAEFDLGPQSMLYGGVSTGFKSGGFYSAPKPNTFAPEKLTAFDLGVKNRFLDNRLQLNLEAFYWIYKDHQESSLGATSIPGFLALLTYNAGRAKSYGLELDTLFKATPNDELTLHVQWNKSKYDTFTYAAFGTPVTGCAVAGATIDCSGKQLMRAPEWTGTAGYAHTFDLASGAAIRASFETQFSSSYYLTTDFLSDGQQKAFAIGNFDLSFTSPDKRVVVSAYVHNVWDELVYTQAIRSPFISSPSNPLARPQGLFTATVRPPRTFGGSVRVSF